MRKTIGGLCVGLVCAAQAITVEVDPSDDPAVQNAAANLRQDIERVCPTAATDKRRIVVGVIGHSALIDKRIKAGRLDVSRVKGKWEASVRVYTNGVWVVAGSDRRGAVYGIYEISRELGVSPFYWWDDIPIEPRARFDLSTQPVVIESPTVKYRGIFINDEDWGLRPWAKKNFERDPAGIGVKVYEKLFEMMLRARLNYLWPAMHYGAYEFSSRQENMDLADRMGIVIGTSHCEPMLRNNIYWNKKERGAWNWLTNADGMKAYWEEAVRKYADHEVMWTLGMRGIHDEGLAFGKDDAEKIKSMEEAIAAQTNMVAKWSHNKYGAPAFNFCPYKEVLPLYNKGLQVPESSGVTWSNDNFGYVRRLGGPSDRHEGGVYWHCSYMGTPHSYLHLNSTSPGLMWWELGARSAANGATRLWVVNMGDVKQADLAIYALGKIAWNPSAVGADAQTRILTDWAAEFVGQSQMRKDNGALAKRIAAQLTDYFNLGVIRKPELMCARWARSLPPELKATLKARYAALKAEDLAIESALPPERRDAWFSAAGFPNRFLGAAGEYFMGEAFDGAAEQAVRAEVSALMARWDSLFGGKWRFFFCDTLNNPDDWTCPKTKNRWSGSMQWPWNDPDPEMYKNWWDRPCYEEVTAWTATDKTVWTAAADYTARTAANGGAWNAVAGLGVTGRAMALLPVKPGIGAGASMDYTINATQPARLVLRFVPDYCLWPGLRLRVGVCVNGGAEEIVEVPASDGARFDENSRARRPAVQDSFIIAPTKAVLKPGANTVRIRALDPGVALDAIGATPTE